MPFCTSCGAETTDVARFCTQCGNALGRIPQVQVNKPKSNWKRIAIGCGGLVWVLVITLLILARDAAAPLEKNSHQNREHRFQ